MPVQLALWRWTRTQPGMEWLRDGYRTTSKGIDNEGSRELLRKLYQSEPSKLWEADPYFVSEEMCDVVAAAYPSFEPEALLPTDILSTHGFLYFATPFDVADRFDQPMTIAAVSWAPMVSAETLANSTPETILATLQQRDYSQHWTKDSREAGQDRDVDGISFTIYSKTIFPEGGQSAAQAEYLRAMNAPRLIPTHFTPWWFGMTFDGNEVDIQGNPTGAGWWWRIAQTTFRLMQQKITVRHNERPGRAARREGLRRGFDLDEERSVIVVRLRREKNPQTGEPMGPANYSHRFIVGGHWRNQPYLSEGPDVTRQIWIADYIKGPEDLPLVIRPRHAFTWSR